MKTSTLSLGLLSLLFVPMLLGSCAGHTDTTPTDERASADTTLATMEMETAYDATPIDPSFFDPYYSEDLYDGLWYYAEASPMKPAAVAARPAGPFPAPVGSVARQPRMTLDLVGGPSKALAVAGA